jgi:hypothetical protein
MYLILNDGQVENEWQGSRCIRQLASTTGRFMCKASSRYKWQLQVDIGNWQIQLAEDSRIIQVTSTGCSRQVAYATGRYKCQSQLRTVSDKLHVPIVHRA